MNSQQVELKGMLRVCLHGWSHSCSCGQHELCNQLPQAPGPHLQGSLPYLPKAKRLHTTRHQSADQLPLCFESIPLSQVRRHVIMYQTSGPS